MSLASSPALIRVDFVSDVVCPWCAIGLLALEQAIVRLSSQVRVELHFQPFELNPQMPAVGEDATEHLRNKYGLSEKQLVAGREAIRARGAELGFVFNRRDRVYNTFDAHRLLHWAGTLGVDAQRELKHALLRAYFTDGVDVSEQQALTSIAKSAGLDSSKAAEVLNEGVFAAKVREDQKFYLQQGINAVPGVVINRRSLVSGGQPVAVFENVLRDAAELA